MAKKMRPSAQMTPHEVVVEKRIDDMNDLYEYQQEAFHVDQNESSNAFCWRATDELSELNHVLASSVHSDQDEFKVQVRGKLIKVRRMTTRHKEQQVDFAVEKLPDEASATRQVAPLSPLPPSLNGLQSLNDLIPSPKLRKTLGKMIADQMAHVAGLHAAGRYTSAKIAAAGTWALWFWYVLKSPVTSLLSAARRVVG